MKKTIYFIEGDGVGKEIWQATRPVLDAAVAASKSGSLNWQELLAGKKAYAECGEYLPQATLDALSKAELAMKGPLETPVGGGIRSLNVTLRQTLDLYACIRPIRYFKGIASPLKRPQDVDMVVFRENTEDVYAGIEWAANTPEAKRLAEFLREHMDAPLGMDCAIGIKPVTEKGCKRLVRKALQYCVEQKRPSLTLVHKGNIMKFTEGAFRAWGYEVAQEFAGLTCTEQDSKPDKIVVKDRIADAMFQEALLHPRKYSVLATTNLNGDYLSDALAAQVGGLGPLGMLLRLRPLLDMPCHVSEVHALIAAEKGQHAPHVLGLPSDQVSRGLGHVAEAVAVPLQETDAVKPLQEVEGVVFVPGHPSGQFPRGDRRLQLREYVQLDRPHDQLPIRVNIRQCRQPLVDACPVVHLNLPFLSCPLHIARKIVFLIKLFCGEQIEWKKFLKDFSRLF